MILIINCTKGFEFAFVKNKKTIFIKKSKQLKNISEKLVVEIEKSLSILKLRYNAIKKIVVITGPGSFTGIRSAITFAKILKLSLKISPDQPYVLNYLAYGWIERNILINKSLIMLEKAAKKNTDSFFCSPLERSCSFCLLR